MLKEKFDDFDFKEKLQELNDELEALNAEARELEETIAENVAKLLYAKHTKIWILIEVPDRNSP